MNMPGQNLDTGTVGEMSLTKLLVMMLAVSLLGGTGTAFIGSQTMVPERFTKSMGDVHEQQIKNLEHEKADVHELLVIREEVDEQVKDVRGDMQRLHLMYHDILERMQKHEVQQTYDQKELVKADASIKELSKQVSVLAAQVQQLVYKTDENLQTQRRIFKSLDGVDLRQIFDGTFNQRAD